VEEAQRIKKEKMKLSLLFFLFVMAQDPKPELFVPKIYIEVADQVPQHSYLRGNHVEKTAHEVIEQFKKQWTFADGLGDTPVWSGKKKKNLAPEIQFPLCTITIKKEAADYVVMYSVQDTSWSIYDRAGTEIGGGDPVQWENAVKDSINAIKRHIAQTEKETLASKK
jgi:hypothetical protein